MEKEQRSPDVAAAGRSQDGVSQQSLKRRNFLKAVGAGVPLAVPAISRTVLGANDRLSTALVGSGRRGNTLLSYFADQNVDVRYVCDVYAPNLANGMKNAREHGTADVKSCKDFREILDDKGIDTLIVASPDHWHPYQTVEGCKAGKDVYVEKPVAVSIAQTSKIVAAARKYDRVVQVGTQQRSGLHFQEAVDYVRSGKLGKVSAVRTHYHTNLYPTGIGHAPDGAPPPDLDWDLWLGPAPMRPFNANRFGVRKDGWASFRWFWDYAGGMMTDWGVHLLDIVLWAMDTKGPESATAVGGKFAIQDNRETPDTIQVSFQFPDFIASFENRILNSVSVSGERKAIIFYGTRGTLFVNRQGYRILPEAGGGEPVRVAVKNPMGPDHVRNFLDCVRSRKRPVADIEAHAPSTTVCLLGNVAYRSKEVVAWDPSTSNSSTAAARQFIDVPERAPWKTLV